jgi:hypothetical protein
MGGRQIADDTCHYDLLAIFQAFKEVGGLSYFVRR